MQGSEILSMLMDGEKIKEQDLESLWNHRSSSHQSQWQRYHLVRDVLRGDGCSHLPLDFANQVAAVLKYEQSPLVQLMSSRPAKRRTIWQRWCTLLLSPIGRLGEITMACAFAFLLILGVNWYRDTVTLESHQSLSINPLPLGGVITSVGYQSDNSGVSNQQQARLRLLDDKLQNYQRQKWYPAEDSALISER
ncbi:MAG: RseA family anti-sigma factor [Candidatus Symbiodolus clandestinus]